jgi:hypothetical protein
LTHLSQFVAGQPLHTLSALGSSHHQDWNLTGPVNVDGDENSEPWRRRAGVRCASSIAVRIRCQ